MIEKINSWYVIFMLALAIFIFSIGYATTPSQIGLRINLENILTLLGWLAAVFGAWWVARRQLILRERASAVKAMMKSNRDLAVPLGDLVKIVSFENNEPNYYQPANIGSIIVDLAEIHDKLRHLIVERTQIWEEHRIAMMPTESEFLFVNYLLADLREDLYLALSSNSGAAISVANMNAQKFHDFLITSFHFADSQKLVINIMVLSLDYGNLLQNTYLSSLFRVSIPDRVTLDGSKILKDYASEKLGTSYQKIRDDYYQGTSEIAPRFYQHINL